MRIDKTYVDLRADGCASYIWYTTILRTTDYLRLVCWYCLPRDGHWYLCVAGVGWSNIGSTMIDIDAVIKPLRDFNDHLDLQIRNMWRMALILAIAAVVVWSFILWSNC